MIRMNPPYGIWTIWKELLLLPKLIFVAVVALCIYSLWATVATVVRLRDLADASRQVEGASARNALVTLSNRCKKLNQLSGGLFYIFGFVLFLGLQCAYITIDTSRTPIESLIMDNLLTVFAFGANVFFLFAVIYSALWFTSSRVDACASKLSAQKP
jgi:hypothetical protein